MKLETFFEKFDQFVDAPNAVAKMRELVLELASKGALSERRSFDQTDSVWRNFTSEFDSRIGRMEPALSLPFEIPDAWRWVTLNDLGTTKIRNDVDDDTLVSFVPMTLISAKYGVPAQSEERSWREVKKGFTHFAEGDVVMAKITPCFENAKSAVMRNLLNGAGAGTTELLVFRGETKIILPEYVLIYVKTRGFISRGELKMTGSAGQKRVPREYFAGSPFPLPPLAEQKRIVAKVDELMALCDRLEALQQKREKQASALAHASLNRFAESPTPANLNLLFHKSYCVSTNDLRKAILTLAVQGKLVEQNPKDEAAEEFLSIIRKNQKNHLNSQEHAAYPTDLRKPFVLPKGWAWARFPELGEFGRGKSKHRPRNDHSLFSDGVHFLVQTGDVARANGTIETYTGLYNNAGLEQSKMWPKGTLCITIAANIADSGLLDFDACFPDSIVGFIPSKPIPSARYFEYFMRTAKEDLNKFAPATAQKNINLSILGQIWIPIPPLAEQIRIVSKVDLLMTLVAQLESQLAASRSVARNLLDALVSELTKKDPASERATPLNEIRESKVVEFSKPASSMTPIYDSEEFVEAIVIAQLTRELSQPNFPLGRMRYNKFAYLAHRWAEEDVHKHYIKQAAGPYNPWAKFDGPEDIAIGKGFVKKAKIGKLEGLLPGPAIQEIDDYIEKYPICRAVKWIVRSFAFEKNDEMELLATVDFAALDLQKEGEAISKNSIKRVIAGNPEWAPKLDREIFSDDHIERALKRLRLIFPSLYKAAH